MIFEKASRIAAPPDRVFAFHESPGALQQLIPPWENVRVISGGGSLRVGERVILRMKLGPIPLDWVAEHFAYDPPHLFADRQISGPFAKWEHRHHFGDDGKGGTILRDEVEYTPPLGWIGRILGGPFIRRKLERMFDYRHRTTRSLIEGKGGDSGQ